MSLFRSFATISGLTMVSRLLGFVRDMLMAAVMGAGPLSDAFLVAFKLPNFFRKLFAEGAFNAAFVPLFAGSLATDGREAARQFAREALSALSFVLLLLSALAMLAMPFITALLAPGFSDDPEKFALTVELSRITFPYLMLISITSLLTGVLNSMDKFAAGAAAPILLNLCFIIGMGFFAQALETPAHTAAWCVFAAGVSQCAMLLWSVKRHGMWLAPQWPRFSPQVRQLLLLMGPAALGGGVAQISVFLDVFLASDIPNAISYLYYADRVNELPLGVIGIAIGTAILPVLSRQWRKGDQEAARTTQNRALELALFFSFPATAALIVIAHPIVTVLFEHGAFTAQDAYMTSLAMTAYATGLPAFVMVKIFLSGFFANKDTKTPVKIAVFCVSLNLLINVSLIPYLGHVALALSTSITGWTNAGMLAWVLYRRGHFLPDRRLKQRLLRQLLATLAMALALWLALQPAQAWLAGDKLLRSLALAGLITVGGTVFLTAVAGFKVITLGEVRQLLRRRRSNQEEAAAVEELRLEE